MVRGSIPSDFSNASTRMPAALVKKADQSQGTDESGKAPDRMTSLQKAKNSMNRNPNQHGGWVDGWDGEWVEG